MMTITEKSLQIGPYQVLPIPTGIFGLDGGAMFGTVPKVLWEKHIPADTQNRIPMEARALLLKGPDRNILIDCGNGVNFVEKYGEKLGSKFAQMYNVDPTGPSLLNSLSKAGLRADDITDVIFTHLHFDHCGGGTIWQDQSIRPQFPRAKYYIQKSNLETAKKPNIREKASYLAPNFMPLLEQNYLTVLDGAQTDLLPCVSVEVSNGHTVGQQWVRISDGQNTLVYAADVIPTSAHVRSAWVMGYDLDPLKIIEEKTALLERAAAEGWYLFFEHDPKVDACKVVKSGHDFAVSEAYRLT
jgi:glyoxylase-like metal-dependent hydrolase (beta-lactamase superfamily II)